MVNHSRTRGRGLNPRYYADDFVGERDADEKKERVKRAIHFSEDARNPYHLPKNPKLRDIYISNKMADAFASGRLRDYDGVETKAYKKAMVKEFNNAVKVHYEIVPQLTNFFEDRDINVQEFIEEKRVI